MANHRLDRLDEQIKQILSQIISQEIKDPDIPPMTTVMGVEVAGDLKSAKVKVSFIGTDEQGAARGMAALKRASGFIRHRLAQELTIRYTPELRFIHDTSVAYSLHIASILNDLQIPEEEEETSDD